MSETLSAPSVEFLGVSGVCGTGWYLESVFILESQNGEWLGALASGEERSKSTSETTDAVRLKSRLFGCQCLKYSKQ